MERNIHNETERNSRIQAMRQRTGQLGREGMYWSDDDKENLKTLFFENVGITDIALILQRTEVAVAQQIQLMNLYEKVRRTSVHKKQGCWGPARTAKFGPSKTTKFSSSKIANNPDCIG